MQQFGDYSMYFKPQVKKNQSTIIKPRKNVSTLQFMHHQDDELSEPMQDIILKDYSFNRFKQTGKIVVDE